MEGLLKCGLYLLDGLYLEVAFNTGLTVDTFFQNYTEHIIKPDT